MLRTSEETLGCPVICTSGAHYVKELPDRVVITWDLSEPFGNVQDFTWFKTSTVSGGVARRLH